MLCTKNKLLTLESYSKPECQYGVGKELIVSQISKANNYRAPPLWYNTLPLVPTVLLPVTHCLPPLHSMVETVHSSQ